MPGGNPRFCEPNGPLMSFPYLLPTSLSSMAFDSISLYTQLIISMPKVHMSESFMVYVSLRIGIRIIIISFSIYSGEIYVAFFNLNTEKTVISAKISDMAKVLPGRNFNNSSCKCREAWSGKDFGVTKDSISMAVETHGCALFVLNCY